MKKSNPTRYILDITYGSTFQKTVGKEMLEAILFAYKYHMENNHKETKVEYREEVGNEEN